MQAALAAYSAIASQAATVVGAMDKVWSGTQGQDSSSDSSGARAPVETLAGTTSSQQQQARLAAALQDSADGEEVFVQVRLVEGVVVPAVVAVMIEAAWGCSASSSVYNRHQLHGMWSSPVACCAAEKAAVYPSRVTVRETSCTTDWGRCVGACWMLN